MIICVCLDYLVSDCIKTFAQDFCSSHWIAMNVWGTLFTCFCHQSHVNKFDSYLNIWSECWWWWWCRCLWCCCYFLLWSFHLIKLMIFFTRHKNVALVIFFCENWINLLSHLMEITSLSSCYFKFSRNIHSFFVSPLHRIFAFFANLVRKIFQVNFFFRTQKTQWN